MTPTLVGQKNQALSTGRVAYGYDGTDVYPLKVGAAGNLKPYVPTTFVAGTSVTVAATGTQVQLSATSIPCTRVYVKAKKGNAGIIAVGDANVDYATGAGMLEELSPGDGIPIEIDDVNKVWVDAEVSGDGVRYSYFA